MSKRRHDRSVLAPAYTGRMAVEPLPALRMPDDETEPEAAYRFIHDELMLDGSSRLNLATFVTTWMEPLADKLMAEAVDKNLIDKDEYPRTAEMERRCVSMVADLFHAEGLSATDAAAATGVSTVGSSEAVMLAGLALKWRWRARRRAAGEDDARPNLVMGSNVQVVWEKFCRYFDVEPKFLPMARGRYVVTPDQVRSAVDERTIGAVAILGTTYSGELEPVAEIAAALDALAGAGGPDVPIHVDAASGGFVAPFLNPALRWDFRVPRVVSINASGHKYGLTYPGVGFVVWRAREHLPDDLVFRVSYLGGEMPTFTLNFSRPGSQIVAQYYNFLRLGRAGFRAVMETLRATALEVSARLAAMDHVRVISDGSAIPVVTFELTGSPGYTVFDVSHELRARGWQVPAYAMPAGAEDVLVLRIVVREGFSADLGSMLCDDIEDVCAKLGTPGGAPRGARHFAH
ncbi:MAG: glutamate decarboxylase [Labilithrix sp.]|nr:glutamate decarboxylase [Labilithrix sp.]MBX3216257.1 glutamate decarboxylase [Labilithrix sp.]